MTRERSGPRREDPPAWPLGCGVALLGMLLSFTISGLFGILFAAPGLPAWLARLGPLLASLFVPTLMVVGWAFARRHNPYAARALLWGVAFTLVALVALTALFDYVDRLNGLV